MRMKWAMAVVGGAMAMAVVSAGVLGQVQVQQNNPLDANPQVGSGGSNQPVAGYVPVNGNDIVTGNVSGLKYFHQPTTAVITGAGGSRIVVETSSLGTFSPYEFQGSLGSASFNSFARQSAGGSQVNIGATRAFYLPSSTVSTGQGSLYSAPYGGGFESALIPRYSAAATTSAGDVSAGGGAGAMGYGIPIRQFSAAPANAGAGTGGVGAPQDVGVPGESLSSPLFGTRPSPLSGELGAPENGASPEGAGVKKNGNEGDTGDGMGNGAGGGGDQTNGVRDRSASDRANGSTDLNMSARVGGGGGGAQSEEMGNGNGSSGDRSLGSEARISGTYRTLLQRLESARAEAKKKLAKAEENKTEQGKTAEIAGQQMDKGVAPGAGGLGVKGEGQTLDPLTGRPRVAGAGELEGNGGATGTPADGTAGVGALKNGQLAEPGKVQGGYRVRSGIAARSRLENMPTSELRAGKDVAPLRTLAEVPEGGKVTPFDELMKNAEGLLKSGRYMESADAYQTAITTEPGNALAVIGRAQAELGAGMYESAAGDLEAVFARKPALMGVHYPIGDFIPAGRQDYLIKDLLGLSTNPGAGNTASFLLCYVYYNTGRGEDARAELGRWGNRAWRNEWEGVAEKAWK